MLLADFVSVLQWQFIQGGVCVIFVVVYEECVCVSKAFRREKHLGQHQCWSVRDGEGRCLSVYACMSVRVCVGWCVCVCVCVW